MSISPRFKQELRDRVTLSEMIGRRVKLVRAGREFKGCCPFHHEKTPSFYVNDQKQFYHCFGCGAHGDAIEFLMQNDKMAFPEAIEVLAAEAGLEVPQQSSQDIQRAEREKDLYSLMEDAAQFFEACLHDVRNAECLSYLTGRRIGEEEIRAFRLGFSPVDGQALRVHLKEKGYTDAQMIETGVLRRSDRGKDPYAFFRERIMFPVADRRGRIVAFGGRVLPDHLRAPSRGDFTPPKYINSSDTTLFHKGRMLYGESHARQAANDGQPVIVVEGYMDVMACHSAGLKGAVAPLGTALTDDQVARLWKIMPPADGPKAPILCFDGDEAGRRAAARASERIMPLLQPDQTARFAFLPQGEDPDTLVRGQGGRALQGVIDSALPLIDFLWSHHTSGRSFTTPEARAGLAKTLEDVARVIPDRDVQYHYRQAFRDRLWKAFGGKGKTTIRNTKSASPVMRLPRPGSASGSLPARILLACVLNHPEIFEAVEEDLAAFPLPDERSNDLRQSLLACFQSGSDMDRGVLKTLLSDQGFQEELSMILSESVYIHAGFARPHMESADVLEGWEGVRRIIEQKAARRDVKTATRDLAANFSPENEQRLLALGQTHQEQETA